MKMNPQECADFIARQFTVDRADIAAAKAELLSSGGVIAIRPLADNWANRNTDPLHDPMPLYLEDSQLQPLLLSFGRYYGRVFALMTAAIQLVQDGLAIQVGPMVQQEIQMQWTTVPPHGGGSSGAVRIADVLTFYPERIFRGAWQDPNITKTYSNLYEIESIGGFDPGVAEALRLALRCFRHDLYLPAIAMLGAAMEAAWMRAGLEIIKHLPGPEAQRKEESLQSVRASLPTRIGIIEDAYRTSALKGTRDKTGISSDRLSVTAAWSDLLRQSRNALHWNVSPEIPNDYSKAAVLLLGAAEHLRTLETIRRVASEGGHLK